MQYRVHDAPGRTTVLGDDELLCIVPDHHQDPRRVARQIVADLELLEVAKEKLARVEENQ